MSAVLAGLWPWIVVGGLLACSIVWLVRAAWSDERNKRRAQEAEADEAARIRVEIQRADPRTRADVAEWLRVEPEVEPDPGPRAA